jgi:molybdopterin-guanine dinucleotide biosynthesis protein A
MSDPARPIGAILCGGEARRLGGRDKAAIVVGGRTLAERAVRLLRPHVDEIVALTGSRDQFPVRGIALVDDRRPGLGPLAGLDAAFAARPGRELLLLAVDLALAPPAILEGVLDAAARDPAAPAVMPRSSGGPQPAMAVYRPTLAHEVEKRLAGQGSRALRSLATLPGVRLVDGPWENADFAGINTPVDLERARARRPSGGPDPPPSE